MGALANHPHRRSAIAYCHCTQLPEKKWVSWSRVEGLRARAGSAPNVRAHGRFGEGLGFDTFRYRSVPISPVRMASRTNPGTS